VVPDGVEEVELAKINLEQKEREHKLILNDIRKLSLFSDTSGDPDIRKLSLFSDTSGDPLSRKDIDLWMVTGGRYSLVRKKW
jgi:hypothetical protein